MPTMDQYAAHFADAYAARGDHICALQKVLRDLVHLERHPAPPWERKPGRYAMMQNGKILGETLDEAHRLLAITVE